jgi:transcriptional regulator with XRE-family HTH domain
VVDVPAVDVAAIRRGLRLSQQKFADRFGLDASAIRDWEQKRRVQSRRCHPQRLHSAAPDPAVRDRKTPQR